MLKRPPIQPLMWAIGVLYAAVFAAALFVEWRRGAGSSALLCPDYFLDEGMIRQCLAGSGCNFGGIQSSVAGFVNPSGWLHVRAALEALGVDPDAVHRLILAGNAFAAVLTTLSATRLGGRLAGILAATIFVGWILPLSEHSDWLINRAALPLLGAVFLAVFVRAAQRPHLVAILVAALCGGVMASFYASAAPSVLSVALLGLAAPRRRLAFALSAVAVFALLAYITTPSGWQLDFRHLLAPVGSVQSATLGNWGVDGFLVFAASAGLVAVWIWAARSCAMLRRAMDGPLAVMVPPVAVLFGGCLAGVVPFSFQYIIPAGPAAAVAAALPCAAALRFRARQAAVPQRYMMRAIVMWTAVCTIVAMGLTTRGDASLDALTIADARSVAAILRERGWTRPKALRSLQTPDRNALRAIDEWLPQDPDLQDSTGAILLNVPLSKVPSPLPPTWTIANTVGTRVTVLVFTTSWLDWRSLRMCLPDASTGIEQCATTGRVASVDLAPTHVANFPLASKDRPVVIRVHVPIMVPAGAKASTQRIAMRTLPMGCHGRILSVTQPEGGLSAVDSDGQAATLATSSRGVTSEVVFEWLLGGPDCGRFSVAQFPPFVVEGDPETVTLVERVLGKLRG